MASSRTSTCSACGKQQGPEHDNYTQCPNYRHRSTPSRDTTIDNTVAQPARDELTWELTRNEVASVITRTRSNALDNHESWHSPYAHLHVLEQVTAMKNVGFDTAQISSVLTQHLHEVDAMAANTTSTSTVIRGLRKRWGTVVTVSEYNTWAAKVNLPERQSEATVPQRSEFEALKGLHRRVTASVKSWEREQRYVAGWHGISVDHAADLITRLRADVQHTPPSDEEIKAAHNLHNSLYKYRDAKKKPPLDTASAVALYRAHTSGLANDYPSAKRNIVVFDTETNGLEYTADILTLSTREYTPDGTLIATQSYTFCPSQRNDDGTPFTGSAEAIAIHGIQPEDVTHEPTFAEKADEIFATFSGKTLAAHNIMFDYPKVQRSLSDSDTPTLPSPPMIDTMRLAKRFRPESANFKLTTLADDENVNPNPQAAHNADYDTEMAAQLLWRYRNTTEKVY